MMFSTPVVTPILKFVAELDNHLEPISKDDCSLGLDGPTKPHFRFYYIVTKAQTVDTPELLQDE
ncbi:unnamed protein product [Lupinus luteus]|uniref:Uncharacterized protein n=1 Tax=Lupinus luteus TaxID=3873 RepID=A0AAV1Y9R8_LUPLU